jgi:hypothetical protein
VASGRSEAPAGSVPVRRYHLARVRIGSPEAVGAPAIARAKRS